MRPFGGNPLAVLPDARGLTGAQMRAIAREFNFAESTFVLPPVSPQATAQLRIFAPGEEMPFAGHASVGSGAVRRSTCERRLHVPCGRNARRAGRPRRLGSARGLVAPLTLANWAALQAVPDGSHDFL